MPVFFLILSSAWLGALASSMTRRRLRPRARSTQRLKNVRYLERPPRTSITGGYMTATNVPLSTITGCPCP